MSVRVVVHAFAGQGDFTLAPLLRTLEAQPVVREALEEVAAEGDPAAAEFGVEPVMARLLAGELTSSRQLAGGPVGSAQYALYACSVAVHRALCRSGLGPDRAVGMSFGDIAACTAAGLLEVAEGARIACLVGRALSGHPGGMLLVETADPGRVLGALGLPELSLACVNDARRVVLSGPPETVTAAEERLSRLELPFVRLRLPFLCHHPSLAGEATAFAAAIGELRVGEGRFPVYSSVLGRAYRPGDDLAEALSQGLLQPARLPDALRQAVVGAVSGVVLEAGAGSALARSAGELLEGRDLVAQAPLVTEGFAWALAEVACGGC